MKKIIWLLLIIFGCTHKLCPTYTKLDYDKKNIIWKGKKYLRSQIDESNENLPWEKPAYKAG